MSAWSSSALEGYYKDDPQKRWQCDEHAIEMVAGVRLPYPEPYQSQNASFQRTKPHGNDGTAA